MNYFKSQIQNIWGGKWFTKISSGGMESLYNASNGLGARICPIYSQATAAKVIAVELIYGVLCVLSALEDHEGKALARFRCIHGNMPHPPQRPEQGEESGEMNRTAAFRQIVHVSSVFLSSWSAQAVEICVGHQFTDIDNVCMTTLRSYCFRPKVVPSFVEKAII